VIVSGDRKVQLVVFEDSLLLVEKKQAKGQAKGFALVSPVSLCFFFLFFFFFFPSLWDECSNFLNFGESLHA
jgi:hypothetical protein